MFRILPESLWPRLEPLTVDQLLDQDRRKQARIEKIKGSTWGSHAEVAIEEARRLFDAELERRRGADNKAGIYLAAITALIPVLASVLPGLWKADDKIFSGVSLVVFAVALSYLFRSGLWAFNTLRVSGFSQLDPVDLIGSGENGDLLHHLVKRLLLCVSVNLDGTNKKVSYIKMTHEFLLRSFLSFVTFLSVQAIWPGAMWALKTLYAKLSLLQICAS
ncbi:conserved membrane hypothetical protein [Pseudomonas sp. 8BK]|uniref:hypothetical protein n=1 Tax=Pseudomonas sp. 8BK TaxID=2653164 RepID=UPI0012F15BB1|nr:hypothetical protein [Pseudomonas sp. 8BK]VXB28287.1 conserved membrane hypothetical protein [Pseudomonas sp. 8BK]